MGAPTSCCMPVTHGDWHVQVGTVGPTLQRRSSEWLEGAMTSKSFSYPWRWKRWQWETSGNHPWDPSRYHHPSQEEDGLILNRDGFPMISSCHHQGDPYGSCLGTAVFSAASLRFLFSPEGNLLGPTWWPTWSPAEDSTRPLQRRPSMVFGCWNKARDDIKTKGCCNGLLNLPDKETHTHTHTGGDDIPIYLIYIYIYYMYIYI